MTQSPENPVTPVAAHHERVLIVDFGSQVTQLIARRVRENGVYCEIHPYNKVDAAFLTRFAPKAIIFAVYPKLLLLAQVNEYVKQAGVL